MNKLPTSRITDEPTRVSIEEIERELNGSDILSGRYRHYVITTTGAVTGHDYFHNLGFIPEDIIVTKQTGGSVTWVYTGFTKDKVRLTTSAAVEIRCYIGKV